MMPQQLFINHQLFYKINHQVELAAKDFSTKLELYPYVEQQKNETSSQAR